MVPILALIVWGSLRLDLTSQGPASACRRAEILRALASLNYPKQALSNQCYVTLVLRLHATASASNPWLAYALPWLVIARKLALSRSHVFASASNPWLASTKHMLSHGGRSLSIDFGGSGASAFVGYPQMSAAISPTFPNYEKDYQT